MNMRRLVCCLTVCAVLASARSALAVSASGGAGPSTTTTYFGTKNDPFVIVEDVAFNPSAGPWHKELVNASQMSQNMLFSGTPAQIDETFTNIGTRSWTDWHEQVLSRTNIGSGPNYPGFLFLNGSLSVYRNGNLLTQGTDYTLTTQDVFGQVSAGGDWEAMSIFFSPSAEIQPGNTLRIRKQIFEVFLNGKIWEVGEAAVLGQYPTVPELASVSLALVGSACAAFSRRGRRRSKL